MNLDVLNVEFCSKEDLKNLIIQNLTNFNDDIFNTNSRCIILCALTCFIYEEILNQRWHPRLNDAIRRIFKDLDFREVKNFSQIFLRIYCLFKEKIFLKKKINKSNSIQFLLR